MKRYKLNSNVFLYDSPDNKKFLIDLDTNNSYELNCTSSCICSLIEDNWMEYDTILYHVSLLYGDRISKDILATDLNEFISLLFQKNFLVFEDIHVT